MANPRKTYWKIKITTSKAKQCKCDVCKSKLFGEKGFLELKKDNNLYGFNYIRLCGKCLKNIFNELYDKKEIKERQLRYKEQLKRTIVRNL